MKKYQITILAIGVLCSCALLLVELFLGAACFIIVGTLAMAFWMNNTGKEITQRPEIQGFLANDALGIVIRNDGGAEARSIHVSLVPHNIVFEVASLAAEATYTHPLETMIADGKLVITYTSATGKTYELEREISYLKDDEDLLKPMLPMFSWK